MEEDIQELIKACPICCWHKPSNYELAGLLQPPLRPTSLQRGISHHSGPLSYKGPLCPASPNCLLPCKLQTWYFTMSFVDTDVPLTWCLTRGLSSLQCSAGTFSSLLGAITSLSSGFRLILTVRRKQKKQEMELAPFFPEAIPWSNLAPGSSPFQCAYGYRPPLFLA